MSNDEVTAEIAETNKANIGDLAKAHNKLSSRVDTLRGVLILIGIVAVMYGAMLTYTLNKVDSTGDAIHEVLERQARLEEGQKNIKDMLNSARYREYGTRKIIKDVGNGK